jgi:RNA polymerase sigma-70 factor (ECF subfamily)
MLAGDEAAFARFAEEYLPVLHRFARRHLEDPEAAREIVQATACKVIAKLATFRGESGLSTWMCACCRNEIAAHFRRRSRRPAEVELTDETAASGAWPGSGGPPGPEQELLRRERADLVHAALDALPPRYGRVLEWKYLEQVPVEEIAARLGVGPKAAESLLSRARESFRGGFRRLALGEERTDEALAGGAPAQEWEA